AAAAGLLRGLAPRRNHDARRRPQPFISLCTSCAIVLGDVVRASPPLGRTSPPEGLRIWTGAEPPISLATNRLISVKPPMSVRTAWGASQAAQGRRKKVPGESSCDLIALRIFCW